MCQSWCLNDAPNSHLSHPLLPTTTPTYFFSPTYPVRLSESCPELLQCQRLAWAIKSMWLNNLCYDIHITSIRLILTTLVAAWLIWFEVIYFIERMWLGKSLSIVFVLIGLYLIFSLLLGTDRPKPDTPDYRAKDVYHIGCYDLDRPLNQSQAIRARAE